ncbi:MAG: CHAT domain-containing protein [Cytophagales bacterium]|nr:CHAT domain-containing protein [Cytophagales bacterium]
MRALSVLLLLFSYFLLDGQEILARAHNAYERADFEEAYFLYKDASENFIRADEGISYIQCNLKMSECKILIGQPDEGRQLAENAGQYIDRYYPDENILLGESLSLHGKSYLNLGRNDLALEYLKNAELTFGNISSIEKAACFNDLGMVYWNNDNKELAQQYLEKSLSIRQTELSSLDLPIGDSYNNLGLFYQKDDPMQAIIYFNRAKKIYEKKYGLTHPITAQVVNNLAFANADQGHFEEAYSLLESVRNRQNELYSGIHSTKAFALSSIGRIQYMEGKYFEALHSQTDALKMYIALFGTKHPEVANTYYLMGEIYRKQSAFLDAAEHYQKSIYANLLNQDYSSIYDLPEIRDYFNSDILLYSLQSKALAFEGLHNEKILNFKNITEAIAAYELCDDLISIIRHFRQNERDKTHLSKIAKEVYESGIRLSLNLSKQSFKKQFFNEKAFQFCERSKSAVLLEAITETKARDFAGIPSEMIQTEDSLKAEIAFFEQQLANGKDQEKFKNLLFQYQGAYHSFIDQLELDYPEYFNLKYSQQIASVDEVRQAIGEGTLLLSYFIGEERIYLFQIGQSGINAFDLPKEEDFEKTATGFRNAIKYNIREKVVETGKALFNQLIPKKIGKSTTLIILPDGIIGTLPFEAFIHMDSEGDSYQAHSFLIKDYAVAYDYSATLLVNRSSSTKELEESILLCAPVNFDSNEVRMVSLPDSEKEVKEIKHLFGGIGAELKVKQFASESFIKSDELGKYKYLHFATHGQVNESKPELSRIFLAPTEDEDGSLYSGEIYNIKINADLVTLSACETGLGKIAKGEGIVGLSRALQYAGANNLIVSLWSVADESTSKLMIKFYDQHLHNNFDGYNQALRNAKLSLLNSEEYQSPYYWAPFILFGY